MLWILKQVHLVVDIFRQSVYFYAHDTGVDVNLTTAPHLTTQPHHMQTTHDLLIKSIMI